MRRQTDTAFGQQQTRFRPHFTVQPWVRRWGLGPTALIQTAKDHHIRALHTRLKRTPDHHLRVRADGIGDLGCAQDRAEQVQIVADVQITAEPGLGHQVIHSGARLFPRLF